MWMSGARSGLCSRRPRSASSWRVGRGGADQRIIARGIDQQTTQSGPATGEPKENAARGAIRAGSPVSIRIRLVADVHPAIAIPGQAVAIVGIGGEAAQTDAGRDREAPAPTAPTDAPARTPPSRPTGEGPARTPSRVPPGTPSGASNAPSRTSGNAPSRTAGNAQSGTPSAADGRCAKSNTTSNTADSDTAAAESAEAHATAAESTAADVHPATAASTTLGESPIRQQ